MTIRKRVGLLLGAGLLFGGAFVFGNSSAEAQYQSLIKFNPRWDYTCTKDPKSGKKSCTCQGALDCLNMGSDGVCKGTPDCPDGSDKCTCDWWQPSVPKLRSF
jgi:hypothetical protein